MATLTLKKPLVLVGLMGCGKSAIGKRVAEVLGVPFVDSDKVIVESEGKEIADIFKEHGEHYFRNLERQTIKRLLDDGHMRVIATGGGAFMNEETRKVINEKGLSLWLRAEFSVLLERVERKDNRPLLEAGNKADILQALMDERYPVYALATLKAESEDVTHEETVDNVLNAIKAGQ